MLPAGSPDAPASPGDVPAPGPEVAGAPAAEGDAAGQAGAAGDVAQADPAATQPPLALPGPDAGASAVTALSQAPGGEPGRASGDFGASPAGEREPPRAPARRHGGAMPA